MGDKGNGTVKVMCPVCGREFPFDYGLRKGPREKYRIPYHKRERAGIDQEDCPGKGAEVNPHEIS